MDQDPFEAAMARATATGDWSDVISMYIAVAHGQAEAFNLTHAYIHALEADDPRAAQLKARLIAIGADSS